MKEPVLRFILDRTSVLKFDIITCIEKYPEVYIHTILNCIQQQFLLLRTCIYNNNNNNRRIRVALHKEQLDVLK